MKTHSVYFRNVAGINNPKKRYVKKSLSFVKKAAEALNIKDSFLGIVLTSARAFQFHRSHGMYYAEFLNSDTYDIDFTYCRLPKLLTLIEVAWKATDRESLMAATQKVHWRKGNIIHRCSQEVEIAPPRNSGKLGHGDHWEALLGKKFMENTDGSLENIEYLLYCLAGIASERTPLIHAAPSPWGTSEFPAFIQYDSLNEIGGFSVIESIERAEKTLLLRSAFPVFAKTKPFVIKVESVSDAYGDCEGLVQGEAAGGHPLTWFAADFLKKSSEWKQPGFSKVAMSGLALSIKPFDSKPIKVDKGGAVEEMRERLRKAGKEKEAASLKYVWVETKYMRTLYSQFQDHASFIGKILSVEKIVLSAHYNFEGYCLKVEVHPEKCAAGHLLPIYAFPPALGDFVPKRGALIQGSVWLQGSHLGKSAENESVEKGIPCAMPKRQTACKEHSPEPKQIGVEAQKHNSRL